MNWWVICLIEKRWNNHISHKSSLKVRMNQFCLASQDYQELMSYGILMFVGKNKVNSSVMSESWIALSLILASEQNS